jgi:hypothetical protein
MRKHFAIGLMFSVFSLAVPLFAENSFMVTSAVTPLSQTGFTEVLGGVDLISSTAGISTADSMVLEFSGVTITNPFNGNIALNPATGKAESPSGITLSATGGWRNSGVFISMLSSPLGGRVQISLPAGLSISSSDTLSLNGVRVDVSSFPGDAIFKARITSISSTYNLAETQVGFIRPSLVFSVEAGYYVQCVKSFESPRITLTEGFAGAWIQYSPLPTHPRPLYGATGNTEFRLMVPDLPAGIVITWPSLVTGVYSQLQKKEQSADGGQVIYEFLSLDQSISDQNIEEFILQPTIAADQVPDKGGLLIQAQLYPPAESTAVPRFNDGLIPANGLEFVAFDYVPGDDLAPPRVQISAPVDGSSLFGEFLLTALVADDIAVSRVQFFLDGATFRTELTSPPYSQRISAGTLTMGPHTVSAQARDRGGHVTLSSLVSFKIVPPVSLQSITPAAGPASGGTILQITGAGFQAGATLKIGDTPATITQLLPGQLIAFSRPVPHSGKMDVVLMNPDGGQAVLPAAFSYSTVVSEIEQLSPSSQPANGPAFFLTVQGHQFTPNSQVTWNGASRVTRFISPEQLEACITTQDLAIPGSSQVNVVTEGNAPTHPLMFTILPASQTLSLLGLLPTSGSSSGQEKITILGSGFTPEMAAAANNPSDPVQGSQVQITLGGKPLRELTFINQGQMEAQTPEGSPGSANLTIQTTNNTLTLSNVYTYRKLENLSSRWSSQAPATLHFAIPHAADTSQTRTNLGLNNPADTAATAQILLVNSQGEVLAEKGASIPGHGLLQINHILRYLENLETQTGREGYLVLESATPLKGWASLIDNFSNDPSMLKAVPLEEGQAKIFIPSSVGTSKYTTTLSLINTSSTGGTVSINSYNSSGNPQGTVLSLPIRPGGWIQLEDYYRKAGMVNAYGPLEITGTSGVKLLGGAGISTPQKTGGYLEGIANPASVGVIYLPRWVNSPDYRTNLGITNLIPSLGIASVDYRSDRGILYGGTNYLIPPQGMVQVNGINPVPEGPYTLTGLTGSLIINSFYPVIGWISEIDNLSQDLSFYSATRRWVTSKVLVPSITGTGGFRSSLTINNLGDIPTQVRINSFSTLGILLSTRLVLIPAGGQFNSDDISSYLQLTDTFGPLELESLENQPILATSRVTSAQHTGGTLDGQNY